MSDKKYCFRFTRDEIDNLFFLVAETLSTDEVREDDEEKQIWEKIRDQLLARRLKIMQRDLKENPMPPPAPFSDSSDEE